MPIKYPMQGGIMGKTIIAKSGFFSFKGEIAIAADFPISSEVQVGWVYHITATVTDNDPTKTNTGQSFQDKDEIFWNGTDWTLIGTTVITDHGDLTGLADDDHTQYLSLAGRSGQTITDAIIITGSLAVDNLIFDGNIITTASAQDLYIFASSADVNINPDLRLHLGDVPTSDFTKMSFVGGGGSVADSSSIAYFTSPDSTYPIRQHVNLSHDNITTFFDSYNDNTNERSSDVGSNFKIEKKADQLIFNYASGFAPGAIVTWAEAFKITTSGVDIPESAKFPLDYIDGFLVGYSSTTAVAITSGGIMANGKYYTLSSDTTHSMTSLASGYDLQYVYIDDDASTAPTATIINSTTNPVWSDAKRGWYNGDDRMIGVVSTRPSAAEVSVFEILEMGKTIRYESGIGSMVTMSANGSPDGAWQTPGSLDGSAVTPVNATAIGMSISNSDGGATVTNYIASAELAAIETGITWGPIVMQGYNSIWLTGWLALGASRNVKIAGDDDDDNNQDVWVIGFEYTR